MKVHLFHIYPDTPNRSDTLTVSSGGAIHSTRAIAKTISGGPNLLNNCPAIKDAKKIRLYWRASTKIIAIKKEITEFEGKIYPSANNMEGFKNFTIQQAVKEIHRKNLKRTIAHTGVQQQLLDRYCKKYGIDGEYMWINNQNGDWELWNIRNQLPCYIIPHQGPSVIISPKGKYREYSPRVNLKHLPTLTNNVIQHIFSFLPLDTLLDCKLVCKQWYDIANIRTLWQNVPIYKELEDLTNPQIRYIQATFRGIGNLVEDSKMLHYFKRRPKVKEVIDNRFGSFACKLRGYIRKNEQ